MVIPFNRDDAMVLAAMALQVRSSEYSTGFQNVWQQRRFRKADVLVARYLVV